MDLKFLEESFKKGGSIHIKKKNRGKFTDYCGGKVTLSCINKAKESNNPKLRKRAIFAENAKKWKHLNGGVISRIYGIDKFLEGGLLDFNPAESGDTSDYSWIIENPMDATNQVTMPFESTPQRSNTQTDTLPEADSQPEESFTYTYKDYDIPSKVLQRARENKSNEGWSNSDSKQTAKAAFDYFVSKGLSKELASGIVGNLLAESNLNTKAVNKGEQNLGLKGYGRGIALWSDDRISDFIKVMGVEPEKASLDLLLDFAWYEMSQRPVFMNALRKSRTVDEAADIIYRGFENGSTGALATIDDMNSVYIPAWERLRKKNPKHPSYNFNQELQKRIDKSNKIFTLS